MHLTRRERSILSKYAETDATLITAEDVGRDELETILRMIQWSYASGEPTAAPVTFGSPGQHAVKSIAHLSLTEKGRQAIAMPWHTNPINWVIVAMLIVTVAVILKVTT
ncbi:MAG: hypothetical protein ACI8T1_001295 [Verrucomicrobiales bacterium]|jgi:hypothetical protein